MLGLPSPDSQRLANQLGAYHPPTLDDILLRLANQKNIHDEYMNLRFDVPKSLNESIATLERQAKSAYRAKNEADLAAAKKKAEDLKSKEKQREEAEAEVARLTKLVGE